MESRGPQPYARMCADSDVMRYMPKTMTREESSQQVSQFISHWQQRGFGLWAVEEKASGAFIGRIGLMVHDDWPEGEHKTEVGWMLDRPIGGAAWLPRERWPVLATGSRSSAWSASSA